MTPSNSSVRHPSSANSRETFHKSGTDRSNPVPSGGESGELVLAAAVEGFPPTQQFPELTEAQTFLAGRRSKLP
jgi:hypothetical protein